MSRSSAGRRLFRVVLIKPSHYDDDGYVIRWWRAIIPSNSLAAVYGIAADAAERQCSAPMSPSTSRPSMRPTPGSTFRRCCPFPRHGNFGLVALVGVQSNQYPAPSILRVRCAKPASPSPSAAFTSPDAWRCSTAMRSTLDACRDTGGFDLRRRGRRPDRPASARCRRRTRSAPLQLHERAARHGGHAGSVPAEALCRAHARRSAPASMPDAAVPISARSAPSSTFRAASRASARPTTSSVWCA